MANYVLIYKLANTELDQDKAEEFAQEIVDDINGHNTLEDEEFTLLKVISVDIDYDEEEVKNAT